MAHNPTRIPLDQEHVIGDPNVVEYTYPFVASGADASGQSDVRVAYDGEVIAPTNYRVTVNPGGRGGTVRFLSAAEGATNPVQLVQGRALRIYRDTAVERVTSFGTGSYAPAAAVEAALARLIRVVQELTAREDVRSTSLVEIFDIKPFARSPGQEGSGDIQPGDLLDAVKIYARVGGRAIEVSDLGFSLNPHAHSGGSITLADISALIKAYAAAGGRAIALGDTDFGDDVEESFVLSQTNFNATTRVLTLGTQDRRTFTVAIPDVISTADIELLIEAHERVASAHWFEQAFRVTTKTIHTRETFQANTAVTLPGRPIIPSQRFTGDDYEIQVRIGTGTFHTFRVAEILAKQDVTLPSTLDDTDSVSFEEGGVTTRIGWHAGDQAYVFSRSQAGLQNISILEVAIRVDPSMLPPASSTVRGGVQFATTSEVLAGQGTFRAVGPGNLISLLNTRTATQTRFGTAEIATDAEAAAGVDTGPRFLTPKQVKDRIDAIPAPMVPTGPTGGGSTFPGFTAHQDAVFDAFAGTDTSVDSTTIEVGPVMAVKPTASDVTSVAESEWVASLDISPRPANNSWAQIRVPVAEQAAVTAGERDLAVTESQGLFEDYPSSGWELVTSTSAYAYYVQQVPDFPEDSMVKVRQYRALDLNTDRIDDAQWRRALGVDRASVEQLQDASGPGLALTTYGGTGGPGSVIHRLGTLDLDDTPRGILDLEIRLSLTNPNPTGLSFSGSTVQTQQTLTGWTTLSRVAEASAFVQNTTNGARIDSLTFTLYNGASALGEVRVYAARDGNNRLALFLWYQPRTGGSGSVSIGSHVIADLIHQDAAAAAAPSVPSGGGRPLVLTAVPLASNTDLVSPSTGAWSHTGTTWQVLLTSTAIQAAQAGVVTVQAILRGSLVEAPVQGGDRVYVETRLVHVRGSTRTAIDWNMLYVRSNGQAAAAFNSATTVLEEDLGVSYDVQAGDTFEVEARIIAQRAVTKTMRFTAADTRIVVVSGGSGGMGAALPQTATVAEMEAGTERALRSVSPYLVGQAIEHGRRVDNLRVMLGATFTPAASPTADRAITEAEMDRYSTVNFFGAAAGSSRTNPVIVTLPQSRQGLPIYVLNQSQAFLKFTTDQRLLDRGRSDGRGTYIEPSTSGKKELLLMVTDPGRVSGFSNVVRVSNFIRDASTTFAGAVELATDAEAAAGSSSTLAVTPSGLAQRTPSASDSVAGLVELATDAEATAGTSTSLAVTPSGLAERTPSATNARSGLVELADATEASAGTDSTKAMTPALVKSRIDAKFSRVADETAYDNIATKDADTIYWWPE